MYVILLDTAEITYNQNKLSFIMVFNVFVCLIKFFKVDLANLLSFIWMNVIVDLITKNHKGEDSQVVLSGI